MLVDDRLRSRSCELAHASTWSRRRHPVPRAAVARAAVVGAAVRHRALDRRAQPAQVVGQVVRRERRLAPPSCRSRCRRRPRPGMIAPSVGITLPTVAPMPKCTSGITATHLWMNGSDATLRSCFSAASSSGTPSVHALMGTPFSSLITLYMCSVICSLQFQYPVSSIRVPASTGNSELDTGYSEAREPADTVLAILANRRGI